MSPEEVFRLERDDPNEHLPPQHAAEAIRQAVAAERAACLAVLEKLIEGHRQREAEARRRHGRFSPHENEYQLQRRGLEQAREAIEQRGKGSP